MNSMLRDVIAVQPLGEHRLRLKFDDGVEGEVDLGKILRFRGVFESLQNETAFQQVRVNPELGTIVWPNGADFDPVVLYSLVTGRAIDFGQPSIASDTNA
jgi:hypothetical protein